MPDRAGRVRDRALEGRRDELRDLADAFDTMLADGILADCVTIDNQCLDRVAAERRDGRGGARSDRAVRLREPAA